MNRIKELMFFLTLGYNYKMPYVKEFENTKEIAEEKDLASYPKKGYILKIENDTIIVRLSEKIRIIVNSMQVQKVIIIHVVNAAMYWLF